MMGEAAGLELDTIAGMAYDCLMLENDQSNPFRMPAIAEELVMMGDAAGLELETIAGMAYDPLSGLWRMSEHTGVNYITYFQKSGLVASPPPAGSAAAAAGATATQQASQPPAGSAAAAAAAGMQ